MARPTGWTLALLLAGVTVAPAADPPAVPPDSAVFAHLDVAAIWDSKLGETVRTAKARDVDAALQSFVNLTGFPVSQVKAVSVCLPNLKQPADAEVLAVFITCRQPYERAALVRGLTAALKNEDVKAKDADGVLTFTRGRTPYRIETPTPATIRLFLGDADKRLAGGRADGPITPALKAAVGGATVAVGVNLAALPDEIRSEELPPEIRPFQPLLKADALILTGKLSQDDLALDLRVRTPGKPADAEKSLAVGVDFLKGALTALAAQVEQGKEADAKPLAALAKQAAAMVGGATVGTDGPDATLKLTAKADLGFAPILRQVFGPGGPGDKVEIASGRAVATNNLKQLGIAMHYYHDAFGVFPPAAIVDKKGKQLLSWRVAVLPYIGHDDLYKKFKLDEPWDSPANKKVFEENPMPKVFALPGLTKDGDKTTYFRVFSGKGAMFDPVIPTRIAGITDGTSNTIMIATGKDAVAWTKPDELTFDPAADPRELVSDFYNGGFLVTMGDGSVRLVRKAVDANILKALITRSGGEVIGDF